MLVAMLRTVNFKRERQYFKDIEKKHRRGSSANNNSVGLPVPVETGRLEIMVAVSRLFSKAFCFFTPYLLRPIHARSQCTCELR